jgi:hypothetical protein
VGQKELKKIEKLKIVSGISKVGTILNFIIRLSHKRMIYVYFSILNIHTQMRKVILKIKILLKFFER